MLILVRKGHGQKGLINMVFFWLHAQKPLRACNYTFLIMEPVFILGHHITLVKVGLHGQKNKRYGW